MVDPFTLYAAVSAINGVVSLINGGLTRNHQDKINQRNRNQRKEDLAYQTWLKYSIDRFGFSFNQGEFLNEVSPNAKSPIVIFDTNLKHHTTNKQNHFPINPLIELESSFSKQNSKYLNNQCTVIGFSAGFRSHAEVLNFYNRELKDEKAVIIYADFDGTKLRIKAVYGGMTLNQFAMNKNGVLEVINSNPYSIELCEIRYDLLLKELLPKSGEAKLSSMEIMKGKLQIQKAIEFASMTSLQSVLDCHFSLFDNKYEQKAGLIGDNFFDGFKEVSFTLNELLEETEFNQTMKEHNEFLKNQKLLAEEQSFLYSNSKNSKGLIMLNAADLKRKFHEQLNKVFALKKRPTILVFGQVGVGKTTLIQKVLGKDIVPDDTISPYKPGTMDFIEYKNNYITLIDSQGFEPGMQVSDFTENIFHKIKNLQTNDDIKKHIHLAWYCIQGSGGRITETDFKLIKDILSHNRTMVVITKKDITKPDQLNGMINYLVERGIARDRIGCCI